MDRQRFSHIAHGDMNVWNPLQHLRFEQLASQLTVPKNGTVLDIGCGCGHWLVKTAEFFDVKTAIGVDPSQYAAVAARWAAANSAVGNRIEIVQRDFDPAEYGDESFDLIFCIGATHAFANFAAAMNDTRQLLRPGAQLLLGEGYWKHQPAPEYLAFLGCDENSYTTSEGNLRRAEELGYRRQWHYECTEAEWSAYEDQYSQNVEDYVNSHPEDRDRCEMLSTIRAWRDHYLRFGRDTLGFGLYLFSKAENR
jgi:cyclopropane fatty-acyl-phospholipid synthase-like methyltransferase